MGLKSSVFDKRNLYISLFEPQLIRSYLLADNSNFLNDLNKEFNIFIITSTQLENLVIEGISKACLADLVKTIRFDHYSDTRLTRLLSFFLYWSNQSPAINLRIFRLFHEEHQVIRFLLRLFVNKFNSWFNKPIKLMRLAYFKSIKVNSIDKCFSQSIAHTSLDLVFISSLTNFGEDLPVAIYFKKNQAKLIGTVRSWDNLTNHGYLKFLPDIFAFHSEAMQAFGKSFQKMTYNRNILLVTPVYQEKYRVTKKLRSEGVTKIAYMCMGKTTNPDDENFVKWLIQQWTYLPKSFILTIVQHPNFLININLPPSDSIKIKLFHYSNSNLIDYYNFISEQDLIICGGTTAALDSAFLYTPVVGIGFEIVEQNYSASALRYFDVKPHTKNFFHDCEPLIVSNKKDFAATVINYKQIPLLNHEKVLFYTGQADVNFNQELIKALKTL